MNTRKIFRWIRLTVLIYCLIGIALYYLQNYILFHPKPLETGHVFNFNKPFEEINIPINKEDTLNIIRFLPQTTPHRGLVIYFHGNMKNVERYAAFTDVFTKKGYEVLMPDYPGFGKSRGVITEQKLYDQAIQVQRLAMTRYHSDSIIIYGKSLGTGIAAYTASVTNDKMLILETPYSSIPDIFFTHTYIFPTQRMISFKIPTSDFLDDVKTPVTIFHGTNDWVIPYRCAEKLKTHLKSVDKFITIQGANHHDINQKNEYFKVLDSLLN